MILQKSYYADLHLLSMLKTVVLPNILVGTVIQKSFMKKKNKRTAFI